MNATTPDRRSGAVNIVRGNEQTEGTPLLRATAQAHLSALTSALPDGYGVMVSAKGRRRGIPGAVVARAGHLDEALGVVAGLLDRRRDVYVAVGAVEVDHGRDLIAHHQRGGAAEVSHLLAVFADLDVDHPVHAAGKVLPPDVDSVLAAIDDLPAASLLTHTGYGLHAWWLLDEPLPLADDRAAAGALVERWCHTVDAHLVRRGWSSDANLGDLARVLRLGGTRNHKLEDEGRPVKVLRCAQPSTGDVLAPGWRPATYTVADLAAHLEPEPRAEPTTRKVTVSSGGYRRLGSVLDDLAEVPWSSLWPSDWTHTATATVAGGEAELWRRPGASSEKSATCWEHTCRVWSDNVDGLDPDSYSKAHVAAWRAYGSPEALADLAADLDRGVRP